MSFTLTLCSRPASSPLLPSSVTPPYPSPASAHTPPPAHGCISSPPPDPEGPEFSLSGWSASRLDTADKHTDAHACLGALPRGCGQRQRSHLKLRQWGHHVLPVSPELAAGVPHQKKFRQVAVVPQMLHAAQATHKVYRQVQLLETLAVCRKRVGGTMDHGLSVMKSLCRCKLHTLPHLPGFQ